MISRISLILLGVAAVTVALLIRFDVLSLDTNLLTAVGIGLLVVGVSKLFTARDSAIPLVLIGGGALVWLGPHLFPDVTVGSVAAAIGVAP